MNLKILLTVYAIWMVGNGVTFLVFPSAVLDFLGVPTPTRFEILLQQTWAATVLGVGVMCWAARTAEASKARDALILGLTVINGLSAMMAMLPILDGDGRGNLLSWLDTAPWALFTVLFIVARRQAGRPPTRSVEFE